MTHSSAIKVKLKSIIWLKMQQFKGGRDGRGSCRACHGGAWQTSNRLWHALLLQLPLLHSCIVLIFLNWYFHWINKKTEIIIEKNVQKIKKRKTTSNNREKSRGNCMQNLIEFSLHALFLAQTMGKIVEFSWWYISMMNEEVKVCTYMVYIYDLNNRKATIDNQHAQWTNKATIFWVIFASYM